jgi:hypothetical protein
MLKSILKLFLIAIFSTAAFSGTDDYRSYSLIQNEDLHVSFTDANILGLFNNASYDEKKSRLEFKTSRQIIKIQVFDDNLELQYQLPVYSRTLIMKKSMFTSGHNRLGFLTEGRSEFYFTEVFVF